MARIFAPGEQVGLTFKELQRLVKRCPDLIKHGTAGKLRTMMEFFFNDVGVDKVKPLNT